LSKLPTVNFGYSDLVREKRRRVSSYGVFILSLCELSYSLAIKVDYL